MPIIETEIWKANPEKPGTVIFDSQRKARDIFVELKEHLKADGRLPDEYFLFSEMNWGKGALFPKEADIFCTVGYGGSEGIYLDIYAKYKKDVYEYDKTTETGEWKKRTVTENFATGKTLGDSRADMDKMNLVASSVTAAFYGNTMESLERYARIATGEEERLYPPRRDNDNMWEQMKPVKQISAEDIMKKVEKSFGLPPDIAKDSDFELYTGVEKDKLYPENAEIQIYDAYPKDKDRGTNLLFHISYQDDYGKEYRECLCSGITNNDAIINTTLDKGFLKEKEIDITPENKDKMPELKQKLYEYELAKIGFPEAVYIPESDIVKADPADESAPKIYNNGDISYGNEYKDMVFDIIRPIVKQVNEQMSAWENSKAMPFENLSQYRILAEYNSIILAARDNKPAGEANGHGLYYVTWQYDLDRNGVNTGHYTDDYGEAKRNFASRAGLIDEKDLLSKKYDRLHSETFTLPERAENNDRVEKYFTKIHNIDPAIIQGLMKWGKLYESNENHNAIFVAYDGEKNPKSAQEYSTYTPHAVKNPEILSDTTYNFILLGKPDSTKLCVFENPLDSLIQATAEKNNGSDWVNTHRMALTVSYNDTSFDGLKRFLTENPQITEVTFLSPANERMCMDFMNSIDRNTRNIDENDVMHNVNTDVKDMKDIKLNSQNEHSAFEDNSIEEANEEIYDGELEE